MKGAVAFLLVLFKLLQGTYPTLLANALSRLNENWVCPHRKPLAMSTDNFCLPRQSGKCCWYLVREGKDITNHVITHRTATNDRNAKVQKSCITQRRDTKHLGVRAAKCWVPAVTPSFISYEILSKSQYLVLNIFISTMQEIVLQIIHLKDFFLGLMQ